MLNLLAKAALFTLCVSVAPAEPLRLALVADTHTTRGTRDQQPMYAGRFEKVIASVNASTVSLVLVAGDLTESGKDVEYTDFQTQVRGLVPPVLCVPGNHDIGGKWTAKQPDPVSTAALERYERFLGDSFFVKEFSAVRIIGVNSSILGTSLPRASEQWQLLESSLGGDRNTTTIVFMHYPPFRDSADEPAGTYWGLEPQPRKQLLALLKQANVKAVLSGHLHLPLVNHYSGIPIITSHPVSFGIPFGGQLQGWTLITLSESGELHAEFINIRE